MFKKTGVYIIENINTGKYYIGSTAVSFQSRFKGHLSINLKKISILATDIESGTRNGDFKGKV